MGANWLADVLSGKQMADLDGRPESRPLTSATSGLAAEWTVEVAEAKGGADWFAAFSPECRAGFAASWLWVAETVRLDVPADLLAWVRETAKEYRE